MWSKVFNEDIERIEKLKEEHGLTEIYELGKLQEKKIDNIDKDIVYELKDVLACVIRDYLRLYNKENLKANYPTVYLKALYPNKPINEELVEQSGSSEELDKWTKMIPFNEELVEQSGSPEELDKWTEMIEETAKNFDKLLNSWATESQEAVDVAFDSLKKIFLGLYT